MSHKYLLFVFPLALALTAFQGQDSRPTSKPVIDAPPAMDMQKYMAEMMKLATPGKEHKALAAMAGEWDITTKYRMGPNEGWQDGKATCTYKSVMGGRWVIQEFKSEFGGMPFEGLQILGYDNMKKKYVSSWRDNFSTWAVHTEGTASADGKTITLTGQMVDLMTPKGRTMKTVITIISDKEQNFAMYDTINGKESLVMTQNSKKK
jgi:Protein of unknown function (DUF1579)